MQTRGMRPWAGVSYQRIPEQKTDAIFPMMGVRDGRNLKPEQALEWGKGRPRGILNFMTLACLYFWMHPPIQLLMLTVIVCLISLDVAGLIWSSFMHSPIWPCRSCRARLNLHNDRRRKRVPEQVTPRQDLFNPQPRTRRTRTRRKRVLYGEQAASEELDAIEAEAAAVSARSHCGAIAGPALHVQTAVLTQESGSVQGWACAMQVTFFIRNLAVGRACIRQSCELQQALQPRLQQPRKVYLSRGLAYLNIHCSLWKQMLAPGVA